jgi:hypothetical protein
MEQMPNVPVEPSQASNVSQEQQEELVSSTTSVGHLFLFFKTPTITK